MFRRSLTERAFQGTGKTCDDPPRAESDSSVRILVTGNAKYLKIDGEWRDHQRWAVVVEDWIRT